MNIIKHLDLSNLPVSFSVEKNAIFKSFTGGVTMLFLYIFALIYIGYTFIRFVAGQDFSVEVYSLTQDQDSRLNLADSPFLLTYGVLDQSLTVSQELFSYLEFRVESIKYSPSQREQVNIIPNVPCSDQDVALLGADSPIVTSKIYKQNGLFCLNRKGLQIGGDVFKGDFDQLFIRLIIKEEKRNPTDLKRIEEILESAFPRNMFVVLFSVPYINPEKDSLPEYRLIHRLLELSYSNTAEGMLYLSKTEFERSTSIFWNRSETSNTIDYAEFEKSYNTRNNEFLGTVTLGLARETKKIVRKVMLFSQFMSETTVLIFNLYSVIAFSLRKLNKYILVGQVSEHCFFLKERVGKKENNKFTVFGEFDWWKCRKRDKALFKTGKELFARYLDLFNFVKRMQMVDSLVERLGSKEASRMRMLSVDMLDEPKEKTVLKKIDWTIQECQDETSRSCISVLRNNKSRNA